VTWKITVQAITYHSYFLEDEDHDGDDYTWAISHTTNKMIEEFGQLWPGEQSKDFKVLTSAMSREHGEWFENADGDMAWIHDPKHRKKDYGHELQL
jgi:hypothetical protein